MFIGTSDSYHFIPLSLTLTLAGGHKVTVQSKTSWRHILAHFSTDQDACWYGVEVMQGDHPDTTFEWDLMKQQKLLLFNWLH